MTNQDKQEGSRASPCASQHLPEEEEEEEEVTTWSQTAETFSEIYQVAAVEYLKLSKHTHFHVFLSM